MVETNVRRTQLLALAIIGGGGWLRFESLDAKCLWLDEIIGWRLDRYPPGELIARMRHPFEGSPPFYNLAMSAWIKLAGDSGWALRAPSALAGTLAVWGVYAFVYELAAFDRLSSDKSRQNSVVVPALLAAALTAANLMQVFNSRQARMYSWGAALLAWAGWALFKALRSRKPWAYWVLYGALALAACYTHVLPQLTVAAQLLFVALLLVAAVRRRWLGLRPAAWARVAWRGRWRWALLAAFIVVAGYAPWALTFRSKVAESGKSYWMPPLQFEEFFRQFFALSFGPFPAPDEIIKWGGLAAMILTAGALVGVARRGGVAGAYLVITGLIPAGVLVVHAMLVGRSLFQARYMSFMQLDWIAAAALLVGRWPRFVRWMVVGNGAALWGLLILPAAWEVIGPSARPGMRAAMDFVAVHRHTDEPVLTGNGFTFIEASYYGRRGAEPLLVADDTNRLLQKPAPYLNDADLVLRDRAAHDADGLWWVSSNSYDDQAGFRESVPGGWEFLSRQKFPRDYWWGEPVWVEHLRRVGDKRPE